MLIGSNWWFSHVFTHFPFHLLFFSWIYHLVQQTVRFLSRFFRRSWSCYTAPPRSTTALRSCGSGWHRPFIGSRIAARAAELQRTHLKGGWYSLSCGTVIYVLLSTWNMFEDEVWRCFTVVCFLVQRCLFIIPAGDDQNCLSHTWSKEAALHGFFNRMMTNDHILMFVLSTWTHVFHILDDFFFPLLYSALRWCALQGDRCSTFATRYWAEGSGRCSYIQCLDVERQVCV